MIAAMAQWEREEISERVAASIPIMAKLGKPIGGSTPYGYKWENKKLMPCPKEAPVRKLVYDLFLEHKRYKTIARILNDKGHRTRRGAEFTDTTIKRLLTDTTAKGLRIANYTTKMNGKNGITLKPKEEWVYLNVEPIVSEEIWDKANQIIEKRKRPGQSPAKKTN